ncbi:MAG: MarR family transcriptional regulator [Spirochaetia bacterium]|nr:MarR family transcriptional regulator [Spirochaetia bacterium]
MRTVTTRTIKDAAADSRPGESAFRVALLLRELESRVHSRVAASLEATGLTLPQIMAVKAVAHAGPLTVSALARSISATKSTVVGIVDRLEAQGLLERRRSAEDRREVLVAFAPAAAPRIREIRSLVDAAFAAAFAGVSPESLAALERTLEAILD